MMATLNSRVQVPQRGSDRSATTLSLSAQAMHRSVSRRTHAQPPSVHVEIPNHPGAPVMDSGYVPCADGKSVSELWILLYRTEVIIRRGRYSMRTLRWWTSASFESQSFSVSHGPLEAMLSLTRRYCLINTLLSSHSQTMHVL